MAEPVESVDMAEVVVISDMDVASVGESLAVVLALRVEVLAPDSEPLVAVTVADTSLVSSPGAAGQVVVLDASVVVVPDASDVFDYRACQGLVWVCMDEGAHRGRGLQNGRNECGGRGR